jgi:hypothetical protein
LTPAVVKYNNLETKLSLEVTLLKDNLIQGPDLTNSNTGVLGVVV